MRKFDFQGMGKRVTLVFLVVVWLVFPLGQFAKYWLFMGFNVLLFDLIVGLVSLLILLKVGFSNEKKQDPLFVAWLLLVVVWSVSLWLSPISLGRVEFFTSLLYLGRWLAGSSFIFVSLVLTEKSRLRIVKLMLVAGLGLAVSGLVQYAVFPYLGPITDQGWDPHLYRVVGSFLDPGFAGLIFVCSLMLLGIMKDRVFLSRSQWALGMATIFVSLLLTYSRASYLAFLTGFGVVALRKHAYKWYFKVVVIFAIAIVLLPRPAGEGVRLERENSIKARIENWSHALTIFKDNSILGVGFNAYRYAQERFGYIKFGEENHAASGSDSSLLLVLATSGIVGGAVFGWFVYRLLISVMSGSGIFKEVAVSTLVALFVHSWFINSLFYPWVLVWVATLVGLCRNSSGDVGARG